ncbi:aminoglycoside phosphotransferase family protein [Kribbella qitaiheensis]|uniref:Aminoglycoside phosphotransferase family protein n=1 Tax=Kribbella qitaiheensis TaxID=1544730 RepID=A0A7G6WWD1_9ACTN|nr:aminoglycoside phosphotransferase family protein [Kribbella qitaiheensis]QNE18296.1 aminoglycoside phosphotransferase family protein [Kribbella qitaiheensis]
MTSLITETTFTPDTTQQVLANVCCQAGLDPAGAILLRHQTNAVYLVPSSQIVVKIARPAERPEDLNRTLALVRWMVSRGILTVPPSHHEQPLESAGCLATFWPYIPQQDQPRVTAGDLGEPLKALHTLTSALDLPPLDIIDGIRASIAASRILDQAEKQFLTGYSDDVMADMALVRYELPTGLIHEDPQHHNALRMQQGTALIDWDGACIGPREWDLVTIEIHCRRFFSDPQEYSQFVEAYGIDIRDWSGYDTFRDLRELRMITTNARKSAPGSPSANEVHARIAQLQRGEGGPLWNRL